MKMTLLEIVQSILSDLNSDEVDSIGDTVESLQVANIVKNTYYSLIATRNWAHLRKSIQLEGLGELARPTHMRLPQGVKELTFVNFNKQKANETRLRYEEVKYLDPESFLRRCNSLNSDSSTTTVVQDLTGVQLVIRNDVHPSYFTSFDDENVVFDSYLSADNSTLMASKVQAMAYVNPDDWQMEDAFTPDLPVEAYPLLLSESQSAASYRLNQEADQKAEQESVRQDRWLSRKNRRINNGINYPNYGRRSSK